MIDQKTEAKKLQLARALSDKTVARRKLAAAILGITLKHLHQLEKRSDFPPKIVMGVNAVGWRVADLEAWIETQAQTGGSNDAS
ncbi:MAG: AlpA family transcriptional regulator [Burkholderiales bacterium]|nr:AlpA family transcriptional regulator [Burkholderiales bacterium]